MVGLNARILSFAARGYLIEALGLRRQLLDRRLERPRVPWRQRPPKGLWSFMSVHLAHVGGDYRTPSASISEIPTSSTHTEGTRTSALHQNGSKTAL
jgi:hypothetical protein